MNRNIGLYLKQIRLQKKLTLSEVAEKNNITASLLSQIENNKTQPSLSSLDTLLKFYQVILSDFFKQVEQPDYIKIASNSLETLHYEGFDVKLLASKLQNNLLESFAVNVKPNAAFQIGEERSNQPSERFLYIIDGKVKVLLKDKEMMLETGDSLNYKSYLPVKVFNLLMGISALFINGTPPIVFSNL